MSEFCSSIQEAAREIADAKVIELKSFIVEQIDRFLKINSVSWKAAVLVNDTATMENIRRNAHKLVDEALDYKVADLFD